MERDDLTAMTVAELKAKAAEMGVTIPSGMKKAEIIDAILAAETAAEDEPKEPEAQEEPEAPEEVYDDAVKIKLVYVGPNLPDGLLTTGRTLWGTEKSIMEYVKPELEKYPRVKVMLVPETEASKVRRDIRESRGIYYRYYQLISDEITKGRKGK